MRIKPSGVIALAAVALTALIAFFIPFLSAKKSPQKNQDAAFTCPASIPPKNSAASNETSDGGLPPVQISDPKNIAQKIEALLASLEVVIPENARAAIMKDPLAFACDAKITLLTTPDFLLTRADKARAIGTYVPENLVELDSYGGALTLNKRGMLLRREAADALVAMTAAARADGTDLPVGSAYRSYDYQKMLYERAVARVGQKAADRESAQPGKSQHQLGLAVDFGDITPAFADTTASAWLTQNAWRYGFTLSYPDGQEEVTGYMHEIWHYRYMGKNLAAFERKYFGQGQHYVLVMMEKRDVVRGM